MGPHETSSQAGDAVVILLLGGSFASAVTLNYIIPPVLPAIAESLAISIGRAALLVSVYAFCYAGATLLFGPLSDHLGRKAVMSSALLGVALMSLLCGISPGYRWLLAFRSGGGVAAAVLQPATWGYLADHFPRDKRGYGTAWVVNAASFCMIMGLPVAGLVTEYLSWRWVFYLGALMAVMTAVGVVTRLPSAGRGAWERVAKPKARDLLSDMRQAFRLLAASRAARSVLLVSALIWFGYHSSYTFLGALLNQEFGLESGSIGFVTVTIGVGYILGSQIGGRLSDRIGRKNVIIVGLTFLALILALLPHASHLSLAILGTFALGFGYFFAYSAQLALATELLPTARSTTMSANYFSTYVGMMAGTAAGGLVLNHSGFPAVGLMSAGSCLLAALVVQWAVAPGRGAESGIG